MRKGNPRAARRLARIAALASLALAAQLSAAGGAGASPARYVYEMCDSALPGGGTPGIRWAQSPGQPWGATNTCAQRGGALGVQLVGTSAGGNAEWGLPVAPPAGGRLESVTVSAIACGSSPGLRDSVLNDPAWPTPSCLEEVRSFPLAPGAGGYIVELACTGADGSCAAGPWVGAHYFATTVLDPVAPRLVSLEGSLLDGGVLRGHQTLSAKAQDEGGGVSSLWLVANGITVEPRQDQRCQSVHVSNPSVYGTVAAAIVPCPSEASASWSVDTGAFPFHDGGNEVSVCASDFATLGEPNTGCSPAQQIDVDNSCTPSAVGGGEELSAEFTRSHAETVTVPYGRGAAISGRLATAAGDPVAGATVCVKAATLGVDAAPASVAAVRTDARGAYSYEVPPGPDRQFMLGYRNDSQQLAREVRFFAHVRPRLRLAPPRLRNGQRMRLWGRLPGPRPGRRVVILQANVAGSKRWITFRRASTDPHGAFHASYRFTSTTRRTRYRFRAVVPRQAGYPWVEGHSRPVSVVVRR